MLKEIGREGRWQCFADSAAAYDLAGYVRSLGGLSELLQQLDTLPITFKDNHRSRVLNGELLPNKLFPRSVVAKQPKNKNQSGWSRALSLLRSAEARQTFVALQRFKKLGISAGEPILVLEKRRLGMIVDSWVVYEYLSGEPSGVEQLPKIIDILTVIHEAGYQHKDPTFGNFYIDAGGRLFVIDCVLRRGLGHFSRCRDLMMLVDNNDQVGLEQVAPFLKRSHGTLGSGLYTLYRFYRRMRNTLKYKLRGRRPKNN